ncbi:MAG: hypothetical protein AAF682_23485 [Planctomycetota bacterium]
MAHDDAHERTLDRVLVGDLDADAPEVATLREGCSACRERLAGDAALERALAAHEDEVAELVAAATRGPVDGEDEALAGFEAALAPAPAPRFRLLAALGAAAAAAVLALLLFRGDDGSSEPNRGPKLAPGTVECVAPRGDADGGDVEFRWRAEVPASARFTLRVFDADEAVLFEVEELRDPAYTPTAAERALLAGEVRWEVLALDPTDVALGAGDALVRFP